MKYEFSNTENQFKSNIANKILLNLSVGIFSKELIEKVYLLLYKGFSLKTKEEKDLLLKEFNKIWIPYSIFNKEFLDNIKGDFIEFLYNN